VEAVFLHANGFNALTYRAILGRVGQERRILALDQRGHGRTTLAWKAAGRKTWLDLRDDLLAVLAELDLGRVVLAGHSMGGTVALFAGADAPERARSLVLLDPVVIADPMLPGPGELDRSGMVEAAGRRRSVFPSRATAMAAYRGRGAFRTWPQAMLADYAEAGFIDLPEGSVRLACDPAWEASNYAAQRHDTLAAFRRSLCPIRILKAERDSTCRLGVHADELAAAGRIVIETVPGTSHFLPMERPDLAQAALLEAIGRP